MDFERHLALWQLSPDGDPIATRSSRLLPVRCRDGMAAMLKIAVEEEEARGAALMIWWAGDGAARVLIHDGNALCWSAPSVEPRWSRWLMAGGMTRRAASSAAWQLACMRRGLHRRQL